MDENFYFGIVTKDVDSDYGIIFPDLPGCYSAGVDFVELRMMAEEALALHVAALREEGLEIPAPRIAGDFEAVAETYKDENGGLMVMGVPLRPLKGKAVRVSVTFDEFLLKAIDERAAARGETRAGFLAEGARRRLADSA